MAGEAELLGLDLSLERSRAARGSVTMAAHALWVAGATRLNSEVLLAGPWPVDLGNWLAHRVHRVFAAAPADTTRSGPGRVVTLDAPLDELPFGTANLDAVAVQAVQGPLAKRAALLPRLKSYATALRDLGVLVVVVRPKTLGADTPDELEQALVDSGPWSVVDPVADAAPGSNQAVQIVLRRRRRRVPMPPRPPAQGMTAITAPPPDAVLAMATLLVDPITVVDGGVRGGFHERWVGLRPNVRLIGFDIDADECARLAREIGGSADATLVALALGDKARKATAHRPKEASGASLLASAAGDPSTSHLVPVPGSEQVGSDEVQVVRLDDWARKEGVDHVDVLKLDIEGGELDALRGAEKVLKGVRAVECEVHFNPNLPGVPLYGEVDAFLRERGFVLWRLRDQAHYRLSDAVGARLPVTMESDYFQGSESKVEPAVRAGLAGQLMWANAHWLHESVFKPPRGTWTDRVRDAVVTRALGFHDASYVALRHALATAAPPDVAEAIAATLALEDPA